MKEPVFENLEDAVFGVLGVAQMAIEFLVAQGITTPEIVSRALVTMHDAAIAKRQPDTAAVIALVQEWIASPESLARRKLFSDPPAGSA